jgi:hypothetical protein
MATGAFCPGNNLIKHPQRRIIDHLVVEVFQNPQNGRFSCTGKTGNQQDTARG